MQKHQSLWQAMLLRIGIFSLLAILAVSAITYIHTYRDKSREMLQTMQYRVEERIKIESRTFILAEENLNVFADEFLRLYAADSQVSAAEFWRYFYRDEQGAVRMKRAFYDGTYDADGSYVHGMSAFIGNNQPLDNAELQRRVVLAYKTLAKLGPAWSKQYPNLSTSFPENIGILFYPLEPWGLQADANLRMNELGVFKSVMPEWNPQRQAVWTGLYYDVTAQEWVVTYMKPIDYQGRYLLSAGHDIFFTSMIERLNENNTDGAYHFIMRQDGYLIAGPRQPKDEQKAIGELSLDKIQQPSIVDKYDLIKNHLTAQQADGVYILDDEKNDDYVIVGTVKGPEWLYIGVYPKAMIRQAAMSHALWIFTQGLLIMLILMAIGSVVFAVKAQRPLSLLTNAARVISEGHYQKVAANELQLPVQAKDEIGILAVAFVHMASNVEAARHTLEEQVAQRTQELALANQKLHDLSYRDALTGAYNRRAFNRDMDELFGRAQTGGERFALLLLDLDYFKRYNDFYGHQEGDRILTITAAAIQATIPANAALYRYGGEEFVVLCPAAGETETVQAATAVMAALAERRLPHQPNPHGQVTISAGVAAYQPVYQAWQELLEAADQKLYQAKAAGRNQVVS